MISGVAEFKYESLSSNRSGSPLNPPQVRDFESLRVPQNGRANSLSPEMVEWSVKKPGSEVGAIPPWLPRAQGRHGGTTPTVDFRFL